MRNIFYRPDHATRWCITSAILLGVAFLFPASRSGAHADSIGSADIGLGGANSDGEVLACRRTHAIIDGHATDIVAAQLLLTIKRTDAPELRGKLIGPIGAIWVVQQTLGKAPKSQSGPNAAGESQPPRRQIDQAQSHTILAARLGVFLTIDHTVHKTAGARGL